MEQLTASVEPKPPVEDEPSTPPKKVRAVPPWAAVGLMLTGALVAFGIGFTINASDAGATSERDRLTATVTLVTGGRDKAESSLAVAEGSLDECRAAVAEAAILADAAAAFGNHWEQMYDLSLQYYEAPVGSATERKLDVEVAELMLQMQTNVGSLHGSGSGR